MARTGVLAAVVAVVAVGVFVARPDDEPRYLGDMPSQAVQAQAESVRAEPEPPSPPAPVAPPVDGPSPVGVDAPAAAGAGVPAERVPAPLSDAGPGYQAGSAANGDPAGPGLPGLLDGLPLDGVLLCVDADTIFKPGLGTFDCLTGELLEPIPPIELPVCVPPAAPPECVLPDVGLPLP
jgi:hypothetical protein